MVLWVQKQKKHINSFSIHHNIHNKARHNQELHKKHEEAISKIKAALDKRKLSEEKEDLE